VLEFVLGFSCGCKSVEVVSSRFKNFSKLFEQFSTVSDLCQLCRASHSSIQACTDRFSKLFAALPAPHDIPSSLSRGCNFEPSVRCLREQWVLVESHMIRDQFLAVLKCRCVVSESFYKSVSLTIAPRQGHANSARASASTFAQRCPMATPSSFCRAPHALSAQFGMKHRAMIIDTSQNRKAQHTRVGLFVDGRIFSLIDVCLVMRAEIKAGDWRPNHGVLRSGAKFKGD
jgi:hypothetical protein